MKLETLQSPYKILKKLGADDTDLVFSGSSQTCDKHEDCGLTKTVDVPQGANAAIVIMHGTNAAPENKTMTWKLYGWREGGPAEYIAHGTATLGTQRVATGTATEMYADTIAITAQAWLDTVSVIDSGNNRIAKLAFDMYGLARIACVMTNNSSSTTTGAKISFV